MNYREKLAQVKKCERQSATADRCSIANGPCPHHRAELEEYARRIRGFLSANSRPKPEEPGTWGPIGQVNGVQTRVRID